MPSVTGSSVRLSVVGETGLAPPLLTAPGVLVVLPGVTILERPTRVPEVGTAVVDIEIVSGLAAIRLALGSTTFEGTPPSDGVGFEIGSGTVAVKVVCWFEIVTGTELGGVTELTPLRMLPVVLGITTGIGLLIGIDVVKVLSDWETVTGTEMMGVAALGNPDATLEMTLPGLVRGTLVVKVLSGWETTTGTEITGVAPLDKPDAALAITPPGLVMGTLVVKVLSE